MDEGLRAPSTGTSPTRCSTSSSSRPDATVFFHDYHLYLAPRMVREARPDATLAALRAHPLAAGRLLARAPARCAAGGPRGAARERRRRVPHGALAAQLPAQLRGLRRRECRLRPRRRSSTTAARSQSARNPISVDTGEFDELAESAAVLAAERRLESDAPGEAHPARRPHRPVEERRARLRGPSSSTSTRIPRCTAACGCSRCSIPSRQDIPEYAEYLGAIQREARRVNDRFAACGLAADRPPDQRRLRRARSPRTSSTTCCS